jgi:hypothetical protein
MANKANFTKDQWDKILQAPLLVGFAVSAGDPGGFIGTLQESMASASALAAAKADAGGDALIKAAVDDLLTPEARTAARERIRLLIQGCGLAEIKLRALEELRDTAKILDAAASEESGPFKAWLVNIAKLVAEAATEGGFLGFGGERDSAAEHATLAEISAALGV